MEIKIVGSVADENALEEIEDIAKVFSYEQRMKDYIPILNKPYRVEKKTIINEKHLGDQRKYVQSSTPRIMVKGLC